MRRDWIWGWVAALPSLIVALLTIKSTSLYSERPYIAVGVALALATAISTGVLWIKNRHSRRKILQAGGYMELVVRPFEAFGSALILSVAVLSAIILAGLILEGPVAAGWSLVLALVTTICAAVLWIADRLSIPRVKQSGHAIEDIIERTYRFWEPVAFFTAFYGTYILWKMIVYRGVGIDWSLGIIIIICVVSYLWCLRDAAYRKPE